MIHFPCPTCQKPFAVPEHLSGRRARCKACQGVLTIPKLHPLTVPAAAPSSIGDGQSAIANPSPPPRLPVRTRRLLADAEQMTRAFTGPGPIRIASTAGDPPET